MNAKKNELTEKEIAGIVGGGSDFGKKEIRTDGACREYVEVMNCSCAQRGSKPQYCFDCPYNR